MNCVKLLMYSIQYPLNTVSDPDPTQKGPDPKYCYLEYCSIFCKISFPLKRNENLKTEAKRAFKKNSCTLYTYLCESS